MNTATSPITAQDVREYCLMLRDNGYRPTTRYRAPKALAELMAEQGSPATLPVVIELLLLIAAESLGMLPTVEAIQRRINETFGNNNPSVPETSFGNIERS